MYVSTFTLDSCIKVFQWRVLPSIISNCQNGYVRNRSIHDSIHLVQDIIQYTEITQSPGVLLSVDFRNIIEEECFKSLKTFKNNKSPGNDCLTKEFYVTFWKSISKPLLNSYLYSQEVGSLSNSQWQAIITLLEKHGQDRCYLANWRPISLLNVDYKILTL